MKATLDRWMLRLVPDTPDEERWMERCLGLPQPGDDMVQGSREPIVIATRYHDQVYATLFGAEG